MAWCPPERQEAPILRPPIVAETRVATRDAGETNVPRPPVHVKDLPPAERPAAPSTGNAKQDQEYQQQQEKLFAKQQQERDNSSRSKNKNTRSWRNKTPTKLENSRSSSGISSRRSNCSRDTSSNVQQLQQKAATESFQAVSIEIAK